MRNLKCFESSYRCVQDALDEWNERASSEFGLEEDNLVAVSVLPYVDTGVKMLGDDKPLYTVVFTYWDKNR